MRCGGVFIDYCCGMGYGVRLLSGILSGIQLLLVLVLVLVPVLVAFALTTNELNDPRTTNIQRHHTQLIVVFAHPL